MHIVKKPVDLRTLYSKLQNFLNKGYYEPLDISQIRHLPNIVHPCCIRYYIWRFLNAKYILNNNSNQHTTSVINNWFENILKWQKGCSLSLKHLQCFCSMNKIHPHIVHYYYENNYKTTTSKKNTDILKHLFRKIRRIDIFSPEYEANIIEPYEERYINRIYMRIHKYYKIKMPSSSSSPPCYKSVMTIYRQDNASGFILIKPYPGLIETLTLYKSLISDLEFCFNYCEKKHGDCNIKGILVLRYGYTADFYNALKSKFHNIKVVAVVD